MTTTYTHILDLAREAEPPADGILSRMVFQDERIKAVDFGFSQGQELSEHTAAKPAMLFFVKGEATVGLGDDVQEAQAGTWVHMPTSLRHNLQAKKLVVMLLLLKECSPERSGTGGDLRAWAGGPSGGARRPQSP